MCKVSVIWWSVFLSSNICLTCLTHNKIAPEKEIKEKRKKKGSQRKKGRKGGQNKPLPSFNLSNYSQAQCLTSLSSVTLII